MRIEMHTHCRPVSGCARHDAEFLPEFFKGLGYDAIVLTNHYHRWHCSNLSKDVKEQAKRFLETFYTCKRKGDEVGLKVIFGAELKLSDEVNHPEFLLYGLSEQDFLDTYPLFNESQETVFKFCEEKDIVMVQAHPFRVEQGYDLADLDLMHGVEIYNSHNKFDSQFERITAIAEEHNKIKTSGGDFHEAETYAMTGMIVPDDISDQFMLRDYLKKGESIIFDKDKIIYGK